ncbi:MAG TPA: hypothetical protein DCR61_01140, partial [Verrucomicrobiales bacterium]|nr:hypothetical protein [Verrucomicrobiales bacterium]
SVFQDFFNGEISSKITAKATPPSYHHRRGADCYATLRLLISAGFQNHQKILCGYMDITRGPEGEYASFFGKFSICFFARIH